LRQFYCFVAALVLLLDATVSFAAGSGGVNSAAQRDKPYLILISIDGFRWDFQDLHDTPALDRIAANGVRAEALVPVFPTLTFPNHYSIATGLYPANHRLIGNHFPSQDRLKFYSHRDRESVQDGSWYGGEPIWVAAEKNGMVSAAYYFVGTEADVSGIPMTYWNQFDASVPGMRRVDQVLEWLTMPAEKRPHLITLYFEDVDAATHSFGAGSRESIASVRRVDQYIEALMQGVGELSIADEVYVVVVSDHGHSLFDGESQPFIIDSVVDLDDLIVVDHGTAAFLYLREPDIERAAAIRDAINSAWRHGRAMLHSGAPVGWHVTEDGGFADIIVQANQGHGVFSSRKAAKSSSRSDHGWPPESKEMHGIFMASGPRLPGGVRIPAIGAIDVYPLLMEILGLDITTPVDGNLNTLPVLLEPREQAADSNGSIAAGQE